MSSPASLARSPKRLASALFGLLSAGLTATAHALPIQLTQAQFATQTAGNPTLLVEDFASYTDPLSPSVPSLTIANGRLVFQFGVLPTPAVTFCQDVTAPCVTSPNIEGLRTADSFPAGTTFWGATAGYVFSTDLFDVIVTGVSGVLSLSSVTAQRFWGFTDPLGLLSVSFTNLGAVDIGGGTSSGAYAFDDITTAGWARGTEVPEPTSVALLGVGALLAGGARRARGASRA